VRASSRHAAGPPGGMPSQYQSSGGGRGDSRAGAFDGGSDRRPVPASSDDRSDRSSRAAVSGSDDTTFSGLSQHVVKFIWFPNDPFKIQDKKVTLLSSFTVSYIIKVFLKFRILAIKSFIVARLARQ